MDYLYYFKRYNNNSSVVRKYKGLELYLFTPSLFPNKPLETMDQRYLNCSNAPISSLLKLPLQTQLYNDTYFLCNSKHTSKPSRNTPSFQLDIPVFDEHICNRNMPSNVTLFNTSNSKILLIDPISACDHIFPNKFSTDLSDHLFFIQLTPDGTMRRRWYLI